MISDYKCNDNYDDDYDYDDDADDNDSWIGWRKLYHSVWTGRLHIYPFLAKSAFLLSHVFQWPDN